MQLNGSSKPPVPPLRGNGSEHFLLKRQSARARRVWWLESQRPVLAGWRALCTSGAIQK